MAARRAATAVNGSGSRKRDYRNHDEPVKGKKTGASGRCARAPLPFEAMKRSVPLLLALALGACNFGFVRSGTPEPTNTEPPVTYGEDLEFRPPQTAGKGDGTLVIYVIEQDVNRPIAGARVKYTGPESGTMVTNNRGRASVKVKPGVYEVSLPPCGERVMITSAAQAGVGVVPQGKAGGPLYTTWEHRFVPTPSVRAPERPPWPRNKEFPLAIRIEDRCDFSEASGASLSGSHAWRLSEHYEFTRSPSLRAGGDGYLTVYLRCVRKGNGEVVIYDRYDPESAEDLLLAMSAPPKGKTFCK